MLRINSRIKADFAWVLAGNILYSACQWGIVVVLAKLGSASQVGEYALGLAIAAPILLFANFQLRSLLVSDVKGDFSFGNYLTFRVASLAAALLLVAAAAFLQPGEHPANVIVMVGIGQAFEFLSETYYGLLQKHGRMDRVAASLMIKGPLSLLALFTTMYYTRNVLWAVAALAAGRLLVLIAWDSRLGVLGEAKPVSIYEFDARAMSKLLQQALPLGVVSLLVSLNASLPRYFIEGHAGTAELGIYSAIASLLSAGTLVVSAFGQSIFLPVAKACAESDRSGFRAHVMQAVLMGAALGGSGLLIAFLFGPQVLTHLFRPEYAERTDVLIGLMIAGTISFIASGTGYVMTAARSLKAQVPLLLASGVVAAAVSAWSIPRFGLQGAVQAATAAAVVQLAGTFWILARIDRRLTPAPHPPHSFEIHKREIQQQW